MSLDLLVGRENSSFARRFVGEQLRRKCTVLDDKSFKLLHSSFDKATTIFVDKGATVGNCHDELLKSIKEKNATIVMEDCASGDLLGYAAVSPRGKYVAVKNRSNGRRQYVFVGNTLDGLNQFLKNNSQSEKKEEPTHTWECYTTLELESYFEKIGVPDRDWIAQSTVKSFATIDISIYATKSPPNKWIKFTLTDAVGMNTRMGNDSNSAHGYFNKSADIKISPESNALPMGWSRPHLAPHTPNSESVYTAKTGWSVEGGIEVSGGGAKVGPKVKHDSSQEVRKNIKDFSVCNSSDSAETSWRFYYTAIEGDDKLKNQFTWWGNVKDIVDLAKYTINFPAECIYRGPADTKESVTWKFSLNATWMIFYATFWCGYCRWLSHESDGEITIDMGCVECMSSE